MDNGLTAAHYKLPIHKDQSVLPRLRSTMGQDFCLHGLCGYTQGCQAPWQSHSLYLYSISLISLSVLTPVPPCIEYCSSRRNLKVG